MQCPIRCPYNGLNLTFPMGALPMEKCPLWDPLGQCPKKDSGTVSQRVMSFPVEKMGCSAVN